MKFNFDLNLARQISVLSAFFGAIIGLITLIPWIGTFSLIFLICFIAPLVIYLLIKYGCLTLDSIKSSVITGAAAGFVAFLAFAIVYIPISILLIVLFNYAANYGIGVMLSSANAFILIVLSLFMGILSATVNAFTGFLTYYIIMLLKKD